jgi:hypothetical protein
MKPPHILGLALALLAGAAALLPAMASSALPKPRAALIVPFKSVDGITLGVTTKAQALARWGASDVCSIGRGRRDTCGWFARSTTDFPVEAGVLEISGGKVCGILIRGGTNSRAQSLTITRLRKWKTAGGVGLGSTLRAAKTVLGKLVVERRGVTTAFAPGTVGRSRQQVGEIRIFRSTCPVT